MTFQTKIFSAATVTALIALAVAGVLFATTTARRNNQRIEETLMDVQFELPSRRDVSKCVVTRETIEKGLKPTLVTQAVSDEPGDDAELGDVQESA